LVDLAVEFHPAGPLVVVQEISSRAGYWRRRVHGSSAMYVSLLFVFKYLLGCVWEGEGVRKVIRSGKKSSNVTKVVDDVGGGVGARLQRSIVHPTYHCPRDSRAPAAAAVAVALRVVGPP